MISLPIRVFATRLFQLPLPKAALGGASKKQRSKAGAVRTAFLELNKLARKCHRFDWRSTAASKRSRLTQISGGFSEVWKPGHEWRI
jgi:hypothetical protein